MKTAIITPIHPKQKMKKIASKPKQRKEVIQKMAKTFKEKLRAAIAKAKSDLGMVSAWFKAHCNDAVQAFVKANLPLAMQVVKQVAIDMVNAGSRLKFGKAIEIVGKRLEDNTPGIKLNNDWLGVLIQAAFDILRATDRLK
jgi:hypothetical protein